MILCFGCIAAGIVGGMFIRDLSDAYEAVKNLGD
jgi:hypothetical protein